MPKPRKRSEELQRPRHRQGAGREDVTYGDMKPLNRHNFTPNEEWDEVALMLWDSALSSGQADYYQDSDLALLYAACEEFSRYRNSSKPSSMHLHEIMQMLSSLLLSEGDRRKARMELQRPKGESEPELRDQGKVIYADFISGTA